MEHNKEEGDYFNNRSIFIIFLFRINLLCRIVQSLSTLLTGMLSDLQ